MDTHASKTVKNLRISVFPGSLGDFKGLVQNGIIEPECIAQNMKAI
jgi:hypothetical protein